MTSAVRESIGATPASEFDSRGCAPAIPLRSKAGIVRAWTVVDVDMLSALSAFRWSLSSNGYAVRVERVEGRQRAILLHRGVLGLDSGDSREVDHINRDRLDNRRCNLRAVTKQENAQNAPARGGTSKYRGVSWDKRGRKWAACTRLAGRTHHHGRFKTEQEAADAAATFREYHMPFATD